MAYHWIQLYRSRYLYGETSLWLPLAASPLDKWRLDETEGSSRMRRKLQRNEDFYQNYPHLEPGNNLLPTSKDTREFLEKLAPLPNYAHTLAALRTAAVPPSPLLKASAAQEPACEDSQTLTSEGESGEGETKENRADDSDSADSDDSDRQSLATRPPRPLSLRGSKKQEVMELEEEDWEEDHVDPVQASMDEIDVEFQPVPIEEGGEDKSIDGMIARLLAPGDCLSLAPEELFLCARVCVVGLIKGVFLIANKHCYMIENCTIGVNRHLYMLPDRRSKKERLLKGPFIPVLHRWYPHCPLRPRA
jgi:hypothetical protein